MGLPWQVKMLHYIGKHFRRAMRASSPQNEESTDCGSMKRFGLASLIITDDP